MDYLALGDSMSIDRYTGREGGGAVSQFFRSLGAKWSLQDKTCDGCTIAQVPLDFTADLITLTIGGNDLRVGLPVILTQGLDAFASRHAQLLEALRERNPKARFLVGNVYHPAYDLGEKEESLLQLANEIIARNALAVDATLIDICEAFLGREMEYFVQWIEPNLLGATRIADLFADAYRR